MRVPSCRMEAFCVGNTSFGGISCNANPGDDLFVNNEFAQLEYNLHT